MPTGLGRHRARNLHPGGRRLLGHTQPACQRWRRQLAGLSERRDAALPDAGLLPAVRPVHGAGHPQALVAFSRSPGAASPVFPAVIENAIAHVFSEKAQDYMKAHKDVDSIVAKTKIGEEAVTFTSRRDSQTRNPQTGEIKDVKGALKVTRTLNNRSSELTDIKTLAKERGFKHL